MYIANNNIIVTIFFNVIKLVAIPISAVESKFVNIGNATNDTAIPITLAIKYVNIDITVFLPSSFLFSSNILPPLLLILYIIYHFFNNIPSINNSNSM